jgi:transposase InsO family protein/transposase
MIKFSKAEAEEILSRFHASGYTAREASKHPDQFPSYSALKRLIKDEQKGLLCPKQLDIPGRNVLSGRYINYTLETKLEALRLYAEGLEPRFIARRLNLKSAGCVHKWVKKLAQGETLTSSSSLKKPLAYKMAVQGLSYKEISGTLGVSRSVLGKWICAAINSGEIPPKEQWGKPVDVAKIYEMYLQGEPSDVIASSLALPINRVKSVISKGKKANDLPPKSKVISKRARKAYELYLGGAAVADIAKLIDVDVSTVYDWFRRIRCLEDSKSLTAKPILTSEVKTLAKKKSKAKLKAKDSNKTSAKPTLPVSEEPGYWTREWGNLPDDDPEERARLAEVRLAEALAVLDVLKVPDPSSLKNTEKYSIGLRAQRISNKVKTSDISRDLAISKSTYFDQKKQLKKPDKYKALRRAIRKIFTQSHNRYGSESVWAKLREGEGDFIRAEQMNAGNKGCPVKVSEKVVRRIMREEGLIPVQCKHKDKRYNSYAGEIGDRPGNLPLKEDGTHEFHADKPGKFVVTDVTEFKLDGYKVYLSPIIDCFDGCPISWKSSLTPNDALTAESLKAALSQLEYGCWVHTDGGMNYRSNEWLRICEEGNLVRSMSRKATSPDNARAEGFFGTLKQEFYYSNDWTGVTPKEFMRKLDSYICWYRDKKIKKSLGWLTIKAYRAKNTAA